MTLDEASALVRLRCEQRLGHLGEIRMLSNEWTVGVALLLANKRRATVTCDPQDAIDDPVRMADDMASCLLEWHAKL